MQPQAVSPQTNNATSLCNSIDNAMVHLVAAKQEISSFLAFQKSLSDERKSLEADVGNLKKEKKELEEIICEKKMEMSNLKIQLAERNDKTPTEEPTPHFDFPTNITRNDINDDETSLSPTVVTMTTISTTAASSSSKKRRVQKFHHSPKKWRRMIRSKRLQSILLPVR